jgi:hypothetical protein
MWHAWEKGEVFTGFWLAVPEVKDHWENLDVGWKITLRWTLGRQGWMGRRIRLAQDRVEWQTFVRTENILLAS